MPVHPSRTSTWRRLSAACAANIKCDQAETLGPGRDMQGGPEEAGTALLHRGHDRKVPIPGDAHPNGEGMMKLKVVVHKAEESGFWAKVSAIPGCATQGETFEELLNNLYEAMEGCLSVDVEELDVTKAGRIVEITV